MPLAADVQRQITKTGLSDQMLDQKQGKDSKDCKFKPGTKDGGSKADNTAFSPAELKDIFTLKLTTDGCQTRMFSWHLRDGGKQS
jgi:DNA repair and recombination protein RAD54B